MVREINGQNDFNEALKTKQLVVIDYTATWCGPCRGIAPKYEDFSKKYTDVLFLKVDADRNREIIESQGIRAFPTFQFFINNIKIDEMKGANPTELENKINQHKGSGSCASSSFSGVGNKLGGFNDGSAFGWDGVGSPPVASSVAAKEARLRALEARNINTISTQPVSAPVPVASASASASAAAAEMEKGTEVDLDEDEMMLQKALEMSQNTSNTSASAAASVSASAAEKQEDHDDEFVPVPVDESLLQELIAMGFHEVRSRKAIIHGKSLEGALEWLGAHQDDANIDSEPYMVRRADALSQGTNAIPLTEEQKDAKVEELKQRIAKRKAERALQEKKDAIKSEKERRERGQTMNQVQEDRDRAIRRREMEKQKKEKEDAIKERARLKALIAADKAERKKHGGVLPSVLGSEGYNPSAISEGFVAGSGSNDLTMLPGHDTSNNTKVGPPAAPVSATTSTPTPVIDTSVPIVYTTMSNNTAITAEILNKIDNLIQTVARYKIGNAGGHALKLLNTFLGNIIKNPDENKYRSINAESNAFKTKLATLVGPVNLLKVMGFVKSTDDKYILISADMMLLKITHTKLQQAFTMYTQQNGPL